MSDYANRRRLDISDYANRERLDMSDYANRGRLGMTKRGCWGLAWRPIRCRHDAH